MNVVDSSVDKKLSLSCSFYSLSSLSDLKMMSGFNSSSAAGDQVSGGRSVAGGQWRTTSFRLCNQLAINGRGRSVFGSKNLLE